jgi:hypothetical protein
LQESNLKTTENLIAETPQGEKSKSQENAGKPKSRGAALLARVNIENFLHYLTHD